MEKIERSEVEDAYGRFVAAGETGDWNAWADLHSEDCTWVEHHLGDRASKMRSCSTFE